MSQGHILLRDRVVYALATGPDDVVDLADAVINELKLTTETRITGDRVEVRPVGEWTPE